MKNSFTLIELLIVIVIIGIIATVALPKYELLLMKARGTEAMVNLRALSDSVWRYYKETGHWPQQSADQKVPDCIDVKTPPTPSNFSYLYQEGFPDPPFSPGQGHGYLEADYSKWWVNNHDRCPVGSVFRYTIWYFYNMPSYCGQAGEKMDENWYRYRQCAISIDDIMHETWRFGWLGENS